MLGHYEKLQETGRCISREADTSSKGTSGILTASESVIKFDLFSEATNPGGSGAGTGLGSSLAPTSLSKTASAPSSKYRLVCLPSLDLSIMTMTQERVKRYIR